MAHEKYPEKCPWDLGPTQTKSDQKDWTLINGPESVRFAKDMEDHNWFHLCYSDGRNERLLAFRARLIYQKLLDKGYKLI